MDYQLNHHFEKCGCSNKHPVYGAVPILDVKGGYMDVLICLTAGLDAVV